MALSGTKLGIKTTIVMPRTTPDIKVEAVRGFGGNVILHGSNFDEAKAEAERLSAENGYTFVHLDHHWSLQVKALSLVGDAATKRPSRVTFFPSWRRRFSGGVAVLVKQLMPEIKVIAVEPEDSACLCGSGCR